ncbi:MAG: hypothetical protein ACTSO9_07300 [Candidatus Helarchaeota archaeon]
MNKKIVFSVITILFIGSCCSYYIWLHNQESNETKEIDRVLLFHIGFTVKYAFTLKIVSNSNYNFDVYSFSMHDGGSGFSGNITLNYTVESIRVDVNLTNSIR